MIYAFHRDFGMYYYVFEYHEKLDKECFGLTFSIE